jgi:prevent-host-death family protein
MEKHVRETSVGAFEAKTNLNRMLHDVEEKKMVYTITRRGKPVAKIVPIEETDEELAQRVDAIVAMVRERRKKYNVSIEEIISARDEGRKW